jgi:hypothetical protein
VLLRAILCTYCELVTIESNDSAIRAATALYYRLYTWPSRGIGFQIMFPPTATWTRAVGLCGLYSYTKGSIGKEAIISRKIFIYS